MNHVDVGVNVPVAYQKAILRSYNLRMCSKGHSYQRKVIRTKLVKLPLI